MRALIKETLFREDFEHGAGSFTALGTHEGSGLARDPLSKGRVFRIAATGRGTTHHNSVSAPLDAPLADGRKDAAARGSRRGQAVRRERQHRLDSPQ